jgi:hypothetical protein
MTEECWDVESRLDRSGVFRVNAAQGWVSVVNPGPRTGDLVPRLVAEAHAAAARRWGRRRSVPTGEA